MELGSGGRTKEHEVLSALHRWAVQPYHRLRSIELDVRSVIEIAEAVEAPVIANLRCGLWYVPPRYRAGVSHFKSGDGHYGQWNFSMRRLNLHLLQILASERKALVVDATRTGKRFPDSLSKTLPTWSCVVNRALLGFTDEPLVLPPWVPKQEQVRIEGMIPEWVRRCRSALGQMNLPKPAKKLGIIWLRPESTVLESYAHVDFCPIFALSASLFIEEGSRADMNGFHYVPGAGDDEESWALGLGADIFHENVQAIIGDGPDGCEDRMQSFACSKAENVSSSIGARRYPLWDTGVQIGAMECLDDPSVWKDFEKVLVLNHSVDLPANVGSGAALDNLVQFSMMNNKGKPDRRYGLQRALPRVLGILQETSSVLVVSDPDMEYSVAASMAFLASSCERDPLGCYYRSQGQLVPDKESFTLALASLGTEIPHPIAPSRTVLKQVHRCFMSSPP
uniref:Rit1 N-terminal domain-containing protein n=1 Tax=Rhodosorus marinus TaxID=101924 RepID=A0A7S3ACF5_9RHOD|mmetsp:Transcript_8301/g.37080  ORF Transcript_8301/g.37080 Transcript_8301/m.37080 type:complete len:451 (+) Transcript_8301:479-1831(+)